MARLVFPSRLELKRPEGSFRAAPLAKVIFTTFLQVSPVQINPSWDHTGTPLHFHSSTTSGSASLTKPRSRLSIWPRQSPSSLILASINAAGDLLFCDPFFFMSVCLPSLVGRAMRVTRGHNRSRAMPTRSRFCSPLQLPQHTVAIVKRNLTLFGTRELTQHRPRPARIGVTQLMPKHSFAGRKSLL